MDWLDLIPPAATTIVLAVVFAWMTRSAGEPARWEDDSKRAIELVHGTFIRRIAPWAFGYLPAIGIAAVAALVWGEGNRGAALGAAATAAAFAAIGWIVAREGALRVVFDPDGLRAVRGARIGEPVPWSAVRRVHHSDFWGALVLTATDGRRVRVSTFLRGFDLFVNMLPSFVDRSRIDERVLDRLAAASRRARR